MAVLVYCPSSAEPVAVHSVDSPGSSSVASQATTA